MGGVTSGRGDSTWRPDTVAVYFHRYRALQQVNRHHQPPSVLDFNQYSFDSKQRSVQDANLLAGLQIGPRFNLVAGAKHALNRSDLRVRYRARMLARANYLDHARGNPEKAADPSRGFDPTSGAGSGTTAGTTPSRALVDSRQPACRAANERARQTSLRDLISGR